MQAQRHFIRLQETQRLCGVPPETVRQWAKEDSAPLVEQSGSLGMDRRDLRSLLSRRSLPVPPELEQRPRVLVADDDPEMLRFADWIVHYAFADADVRTAPDAESALSLLGKFRPDLLVTDLRMPGRGGGVGLCRAVREDPALAHAKVMVVTGYDEPGAREKLRDQVDAYVVKPFEPKDLRDIVFRLLGPAAAGVEAA